eukprot:5335603-Prymnesium_polylepis.1
MCVAAARLLLRACCCDSRSAIGYVHTCTADGQAVVSRLRGPRSTCPVAGSRCAERRKLGGLGHDD